MQRRELLVSVAHGQRLRRLDKTARPLGVFLNIHRWFPSACRHHPGRDQQKWEPVLRPIAPIFYWRVTLTRNRTHFRGSRGSMIAASSLGFRAAALTFLNRPAVVAIIFQA
jgi:hypothetical protein